MAAKFAVSLMALLGAVSAQSSGYTNSSSIATSTTSSASSTFSNGAMVTNAGVVFTIMDDTTYSDVTPLQLSRKRQAASGIGSCLNTCSDNVQCAGASYSDDTQRCEYYSSVNQDSETSTPGTDFALVESRPGASSSANTTASATGSATPSGGPVGGSNSTRSATGSSTRSAGMTGAGNSTSSRPTGSASRTSSGVSSTTSGAAVSTPSTVLTIDGVLFLIEINISRSGITIDFAILAKRATETLDECLRTCAANSNCAGTEYDNGMCTFFTSIDESSTTVTQGSTFATVISRAGQTGTGAGSNSTNSTTPAAPSNVTAESFICPKLNGGVLVSNLEITFAISCSEFLIGTTFDLLSEVQQKRQAVENGLPQTLSNCVDLCSLSQTCVGTTFSEASGCSFYSDVRYATPMDGFDSAVKVQDNSGNGVTTTTVIAGQTITTTVTQAGATTTQYVGATSVATVYTTIVSTVTQYAGPTGYPSGATVTVIQPVSTMTYAPSVETITLPQNYASQPTVTVTVGGAAAPTETVIQTVDQNGNVIGQSTVGAAAGAAGAGLGSYPTVTVYSACTTPAAQNNVVWTTIYT